VSTRDRITDGSAQLIARAVKRSSQLMIMMMDANPGITPLGEAYVKSALLFKEHNLRIDLGYGRVQRKNLHGYRLVDSMLSMPLPAVQVFAHVLCNSPEPVVEQAAELFAELGSQRPRQYVTFGIAVAAEIYRSAKRIRAEAAVRAQQHEHAAAIVQLALRAVVCETNDDLSEQWGALESAAVGGCKTFLASAESQAAHRRYLRGSLGAYYDWVHGFTTEFWDMLEKE
jgi:hypothetical protein